MTRTFTVSITRKPGLSDPEGTTTRKALIDLGFTDVSHVSFGRTIVVTIDAPDEDEARAQIEAMCVKLLANPVMESYVVEASS
ncbi:MAG: phosphoribosylformylglycinamidine synthase subunit PurS [Acidimicrobiia bacterium]